MGFQSVVGRVPVPWFLLTPPSLHPWQVARERLTDTLDGLVAGHRVTQIVAPSGYGKSTALARWRVTAQMPVAWLTLTHFDADPHHLARSISDALTSSLASASGLQGTATDTVAELFAQICHQVEEAAEPVALVIDDVQWAGVLDKATLLGSLISTGPPQLRLVLTGSEPVSGLLAAAFLRGEAGELGVGDLAMTRDEVAETALAAG